MIRGRLLPFEIVLFIFFWISSSVALGFFIPHLKPTHVKRAVYGFGIAFAGLVIVLGILGTIVVVFD